MNNNNVIIELNDTIPEINKETGESIFEKSKKLVNTTFHHKPNLLEIAQELLTLFNKVDIKDYPSIEDSLIIFKNNKTFVINIIKPNFVVINGVVVTTSVIEILSSFKKLPTNTIVVTLPHTRIGYSGKKIPSHPTILVKSDLGWTHHNKPNKTIKEDNLVPFFEDELDTEIL